MSNTIRIRRRAAGGASGAPSSLANAELAFNEQDDTLYYGKGTGGAGGTATSVIAIGGPGSFAQLASPTFTGTPAAPTAAVDTNSTQVATTAYVLGQLNSTAGTIAMNGTQAAGTSLRIARADHVHPTDTSRAPLASPTFSGVVTLPAGSASVAGGIKLTSGTVKTTPVAGDSGGIEYDGTTVSVINSAGVRKNFAYTDSNITGTASNVTGTVAIANGGTGATTAGAALTNLGAAPLASPTFTGTPSGPTAAVDTNTTQFATTAFVLAQASGVNPVMNGTVAIGTSTRFARADHVHPTDTSRAPLASPTFTGTPAAPTAAVDTNTTQLATTAFVIGQASSTAGAALGTAAVGTSLRYARADHVHAMPTRSQIGAPTADVSNGGFKLTNVADPVNAQDAATKNYVDNVALGLDVKGSVRAATTANITLSGAQTIDGISVVAGDRVLVKNQTTASQNGIYLAAAGAWSRTTDADAWAELVSAFTFVEQGTVNGDTGWVCTVDAGGTLGTTNVTFTQFTSSATITAGNGLTQTGNQFDVGGTANRITVSADAVDIAATYVGQTSITTLGTITTGTWNGTTIAVANGGTGATTLTGYVRGNGTSAFTASATIPNTDITGLGTMSTQAASNVSITGGTIAGCTIDGGTF